MPPTPKPKRDPKTGAVVKPKPRAKPRAKAAPATAATPPKPPQREYLTMGPLVCAFIEATFVQTKGEWAQQPLVLEQWQRDFLDEAFLIDPRTGLRVYNTVCLGLPAKCGKSTLVSAIGIYGLMADNVNGILEGAPEVYATANSVKQAGAVFEQTRMTIKSSKVLSSRLDVQKKLIWNDANLGQMMTLASDSDNVHGVNPSMIVVDELGSAPDDKMLVTLQKSVTARRQALTVIISHTGRDRYGPLGIMYDEARAHPELEVYGAKPDEPLLQILRDRENGFLFWWYGLQDGYDPEDPVTWRKCNPASWKTDAKLKAQRNKKGYTFVEFCRYDLNAWVSADSNELLAPGAFMDCADEESIIPRGADVWLGVDAARKDDCGAVIVCRPVARQGGDVEYHIESHILEYPQGAQSMAERIELLIRKLDRRYKIREIHYDPHVFVRSADMLEAEGFEMAEWPQTDSRMVPATRLFREAVYTHRLVHDGDVKLATHVNNTVTKECDRGERADKKRSRNKVDGCIATIIAVAATQNAIASGSWGANRKLQIIPIG